MRATDNPDQRHDLAAVALLTTGFLLAAAINRFPLIFPDTGVYLGIAFGHEYAVDRSSLYGFLLKPEIAMLPTLGGLWLAIALQCLAVALPLWFAARILARGHARALLILGATLLSTPLAWHAAQFMPDAFTGVTILLAWLAARRDPAADGSALLWFAASLAALVHYTHIPLLLTAAAGSIAAQRLLGLAWREVGRRGAAALASAGLAVIVQIALNAAVLGRPALAPAGPVFLFARLNEDGLIPPWLVNHCGRDAPARLCALAPTMPRNSQALLWNNNRSPVPTRIWEAPNTTRWTLVDDMAVANRGAILARPLVFLTSAIRGGARQFGSFAALDDECPDHCTTHESGVGGVLLRNRPDAFAAFTRSRQYLGTSPRRLIRLITTPVSVAGLLALPLMMVAAWRRRDRDAFAFTTAVGLALIVNAMLAGALSDVHDRYQSRLVWLAPLAVLTLVARWWRPRRQPALAAA